MAHVESVHQIIQMIKWIRTSKLPIENSLSLYEQGYDKRIHVWDLSKHASRALVSSLSGNSLSLSLSLPIPPSLYPSPSLSLFVPV